MIAFLKDPKERGFHLSTRHSWNHVAVKDTTIFHTDKVSAPLLVPT